MEQKMDHRYLCNNKEKFIKNLRLFNQRAEVEPEIVDLIEAYAGLRFLKSIWNVYMGEENYPGNP